MLLRLLVSLLTYWPLCDPNHSFEYINQKLVLICFYSLCIWWPTTLTLDKTGSFHNTYNVFMCHFLFQVFFCFQIFRKVWFSRKDSEWQVQHDWPTLNPHGSGLLQDSGQSLATKFPAFPDRSDWLCQTRCQVVLTIYWKNF